MYLRQSGKSPNFYGYEKIRSSAKTTAQKKVGFADSFVTNSTAMSSGVGFDTGYKAQQTSSSQSKSKKVLSSYYNRSEKRNAGTQNFDDETYNDGRD